MQKPKILLISLGSIGRRHLKNTRALLPGAHIAVYRQYTKNFQDTPEEANDCFSNIDDALSFNPDAVIIASPASEHIKNAEPFLERNIPLFIEKPLAHQALGLDIFVEKVKKSKSFVMVGYVLRFLPLLPFIKKLILDGSIGDVYTASVEVGQYLPDWRPNSDYRKGVSAQASLGGGAMLELSHEIDYSVWLFGRPNTLQCTYRKLSDLEIDVEDSAHLLLEYPQKVVSVKLDFLQRVANMALQIVTSKGTLKADLIREEVHFFSPDKSINTLLKNPVTENGNEIYMRQFDFFFWKALSGYTPIFDETKTFDDWVDINQAVHIMNIVDTAKSAHKEGHRKEVLNG